MAKKRKHYSEQERAAILADMNTNGLTQIAAAKKHGVSAVTIWQWKRAAKTSNDQGAAARERRAPNGSLDGLLRSQVRDRIREILPEIVREEISVYVAQALGPKRG